MIDYLLNITLMADSEAARMQWIVSTQQWTVLVLMILLVAVPLLMYSRYQRLNARRQREVNDLLARHNRELAEAKTQAEDTSRMKTQFIQLVTREIRTPLSSIVGFSEVLADFDIEITEEEMHTMIRHIVADAWAVKRVIDKMIDLSELLSTRSVSLGDSLTTSDLVQSAAERTGIREAHHVDFSVRTVGDSGETVLQTNRHYAVSALAQLLDNAAKFSLKSDDPDVAAAVPPRSRRVTVLVSVVQAAVSFVVEDMGCGVPPAEAERIFGKFVQLDEFRQGTGIGLTVARHAARLLGGEVWLDTAYSPGARFVMSLPLNPSHRREEK